MVLNDSAPVWTGAQTVVIPACFELTYCVHSCSGLWACHGLKTTLSLFC